MTGTYYKRSKRYIYVIQICCQLKSKKHCTCCPKAPLKSKEKDDAKRREKKDEEKEKKMSGDEEEEPSPLNIKLCFPN